MATNTAPTAKSPQNTNIKSAEPPKAVDTKPDVAPQAVEPVQASEAPVAPTQAEAPKSNDKGGEKVIISLSVSPKLAKQVRLLSKLEARSITSIFVDSVAAEIPARLKTALASIVEE